MKLAVIDHKIHFNRLKERLQTKGISVDLAETLEEFEKNYGSLNNYDGLLLHPGIENQTRYLRTIPEHYPNLRYAIASHGLADYLDNGKVWAFDFTDIEGILNYFSLVAGK